MTKGKEIAVLVVCMGNICRSPAGEAILKHLSCKNHLKIQVDSCGIGNWHVGQLPDRRMEEACKKRGILLNGRAKQFQREFFEKFDYILAVDQEVLKNLYHLAETPEQKSKLSLISAFSQIYRDREIPDPYYQSHGAFEFVLDMLEECSQSFLEHLKAK